MDYFKNLLSGASNANFITDRTSRDQKCCHQFMKITSPAYSDDVKKAINAKKNYKAPSTGHLKAEGFRYGGNEFKNKNEENCDQSVRGRGKAIKMDGRDYLSVV